MRYFRVKPDSSFFAILRAYEQQSAVWDQHQAEIEQLLGCSIEDNLLFSVQQLGLKVVPEALKKHFKAKPVDGFYLAKENSKLKKQWTELAHELKLPHLTLVKLLLVAGVHVVPGTPKIKQILPIGDEVFVIGEEHEAWTNVSWAEAYTERHVMELRKAHEEKGAMAHELVEIVG